jgi:CHAT domain-containing protein/HEAT repeat protein
MPSLDDHLRALYSSGHHASPGRAEAARALRAFPRRLVARPLLRVLAEEDEDVRQAAEQALEAHGLGRLARAVGQALASWDRESLRQCLADLDDEQARFVAVALAGGADSGPRFDLTAWRRAALVRPASELERDRRATDPHRQLLDQACTHGRRALWRRLADEGRKADPDDRDEGLIDPWDTDLESDDFQQMKAEWEQEKRRGTLLRRLAGVIDECLVRPDAADLLSLPPEAIGQALDTLVRAVARALQPDELAHRLTLAEQVVARLGQTEPLLRAVQEERRAERPLSPEWERNLLALLARVRPAGARAEGLLALGSSDIRVFTAGEALLCALGEDDLAERIEPLLERAGPGFADLVRAAETDPDLELPFLRHLGESPDYEPTTHCAVGLLLGAHSERGLAAVREWLVAGAPGGDQELVGRALRGLEVPLGNGLVSFLIEQIIAGKEPVAGVAAEMLAGCGEAAIVPLWNAIHRQYGQPQARLVRVLAQAGQAAPAALLCLLADRDPGRRDLVVRIVQGWGDDWASQVETYLALGSRNVQVRRAAAAAAGDLGRPWLPALRPALTALLADPDVWPEAAGALGRLGEPACLAALADALARVGPGSASQPLRAALAACATEEQLRACLGSGSAMRRRGTALFLAEHTPSASLLPALRDALTGTDTQVRRWAATALGRAGDRGACVALLGLLGDDDRDARAAALRALRSILGAAVPQAVTRGEMVELRQEVEQWLAAGLLPSPGPAPHFLAALAEGCTRNPDDVPALLDVLEGAIRAAGVPQQQPFARLGLALAMLCGAQLAGGGDLHAAVTVQGRVVELARALGLPQVEWRAWWAAGRCQQRGGDERAAWTAFLRAGAVIDRMWFALLDERGGRDFFRDKATFYDEVVLCGLRLGYDAQALEFAEKAKTRYLGDLIARRQRERRRELAPLARAFWDAIEEAGRGVRGGPGTSGQGQSWVIVDVSPGGAGEGPAYRPRRRAQWEDYLGRHGDEESARLLDVLWDLAAVAPREPDGKADLYRAALEAMYRVLVPLRDAFEQPAPPLPADWQAWADTYPMAADRIANAGRGDLAERLHGAAGAWSEQVLLGAVDGEACLLAVRAALEALDAYLGHEPVLAVAGPGPSESRHRFRVEARREEKRSAAPQESVAAAGARLEGSEWQYVERLARGDTVSYRDVHDSLAGHEDGAVVQFHVTGQGTVAFLVRGSRAPAGAETRMGPADLEVFTLPNVTVERLTGWLLGADGWFSGRPGWQAGQPSPAMEALLAEVYTELFAPLHARLRELGVRRLMLVPHRGLHVLPLHALCWSEGGTRRYLVDDFEITWTPSSTLAQVARQRQAGRYRGRSLLAVQDSRGDLPDTATEVASIARHFPGAVRVLSGSEAELTRLRAEAALRSYFHFAGHAVYRFDSPLDSCLLLAGPADLAAGALFEGALPLSRLSLACLSACETGMSDPRDAADEHIGLAGGFLFSGSAAVLSALWPVADQATALLMGRFYELLLGPTEARPAAALRSAQRWLRDLSVAGLHSYLAGRTCPVPAQAGEALRENYPAGADAGTQRPFAAPYWWAAFTLSSCLLGSTS